MSKIISTLAKAFVVEEAKAHCDVPCGIYDPITAQIAALTVVRMVDLINDHRVEDYDNPAEYQNRLSRLIQNKEEHSEKTKHEIRVIWGDFIKAPHLEKYPQIHSIVHKIMALGSESKQKASRDAAVQLVEAVNEFAQIFWEIKGLETKKAKAPYAPALELVYPVL